MFCRKIRGKKYTTEAVDAVSTWMLDNGFEKGKCTERSAASLSLRYVPPKNASKEKPKKSKGDTVVEAADTFASEATPKQSNKEKKESNTNTTST